jgi:hypothetical protein
VTHDWFSNALACIVADFDSVADLEHTLVDSVVRRKRHRCINESKSD